LIKFPGPTHRDYDVLVVDDGTTDFWQQPKLNGIEMLTKDRRMGVGNSIRLGMLVAWDREYDVVAFLSGNGKTTPDDLPNLLNPIRYGGYDFVQGSRFIEGGSNTDAPLFRRLAMPLVSRLLSWLVGQKITDPTCGVRAFRLKPFMVMDSPVRITQDWLRGYGMEYYLLWYAVKMGLKMEEVPVRVTYPKGSANSKIRPVIDWWNMLKPFILLRLGLRK